jgi:putative DNA primase/helicase
MKKAAQDYGKAGWKVLPIWWLTDELKPDGKFMCGCGDPFCKAAGKHPLIDAGRLMANASSDINIIGGWWDDWPTANIAVITGRLSGIIVIDLDVHGEEDGEVELGAWAAGQGFDVPQTLIAETGGGGRHLVYRAAPDDGGPPIKNATAWLPGVDLRGEGGYILAAPSRHETGGVYRWLSSNPIAELGPLLGPLRLARGTARGGGTGDQPSYDYREACRSGPPRGTRDHFFNSRAFELRRQDVTYDEARRELRRLWDMTEQPAGDEFPWETVQAKQDRVWQEIEPDPLPDWDPLAQAARPQTGSPKGKDTDLGNAQRFVELKSGTVRHTAQAGWFRWSSRHWQHDGRGLIIEEATHVVESLYAEVEKITDPDSRDTLLRWAKTSESSSKIEAMLKIARGLPPVAGDVLDFNPDPWLFNVENGVLDLRTGSLLPHDPGLMISRLSEATYDPDARDDRWDRFLKTVTQGDDDLEAYLRRAAGYTLTADTREEVFFIIYGPQASGKSTFIDALMTILGDMAMLTQAETLMHQRGNQAPKEELAAMLDKRMVATIEIPDGGRFAESLVKQMTGGDKLAARHLYKDRFEFQPVFKLWIATNHAPRAYDDAIWRRIKRVPFPVTVPYQDQDPRLKAELKVPRTGLARAALAWAVRGCLEWQAHGLGTCAAVEADTATYAEEQDKFGRFIEDELILDPMQRTTGRELYERYTTWCGQEGERPMTSTAFSIKLKDRGFQKVTAVRPIAWDGLALQARSMYGV